MVAAAHGVTRLQAVLVDLGTIWVLWLLGGLLVVVVAIALDRWLLFRTRDADLNALAPALDRLLAGGDHAGALTLLGRTKATAAAIAAAGIRLAERGSESAERAMKSASAMERTVLERRLAVLATIGNNAPFLGLFGTVIGVIEAFAHLGAEITGAAATQASSQLVMRAIAEALVTTAVGLLVAIPTVALNNYLQRRVSGLIASSDVLSNLVLAYLAAPVAGPDRRGDPHVG